MQPENNEEVTISVHISIMTLRINRLNAPVQGDKVTERIQKQALIYAAYKRLTSDLKINRPKV